MVRIDDSNRNLHKCNTALAGYINITYIKRQYVLTDKKRFCSIGSNDKRQEIATSRSASENTFNDFTEIDKNCSHITYLSKVLI